MNSICTTTNSHIVIYYKSNLSSYIKFMHITPTQKNCLKRNVLIDFLEISTDSIVISNLRAGFYLWTTYFNVHSLQLAKLLPSSNNHKLGLIVINKDSVLDQPTPDLLNTTFHHTNCNLLGCATVRLETQINLCVIHIAVRVWKLILHDS